MVGGCSTDTMSIGLVRPLQMAQAAVTVSHMPAHLSVCCCPRVVSDATAQYLAAKRCTRLCSLIKSKA